MDLEGGGISGHQFGCSEIHLSLGGREILSGVSLNVTSGEIVGIAGPNGAGKTSLLDVLSGRHRNYTGDVRLDGESLNDLRHPYRVRRGVARTFQHPVVPENLTVAEVMEASRKAFSPTRSRMDAEWAVDMVHLDAPQALTCGGLETLDRRKVLLACLLMLRPKVLLLDEPASGLVSAEIDELDFIIKEAAWELQIGVVIVEHRLELLDAITDRVAVMDVGRIIAEGSAEAVFSDPVVRDAYFDTGSAEEEISEATL